MFGMYLACPGITFLTFFKQIEESPLTLINTCNELNGAYAAPCDFLMKFERKIGRVTFCVTRAAPSGGLMNRLGSSRDPIELFSQS